MLSIIAGSMISVGIVFPMTLVALASSRRDLRVPPERALLLARIGQVRRTLAVAWRPGKEAVRRRTRTR